MSRFALRIKSRVRTLVTIHLATENPPEVVIQALAQTSIHL